MNGFDPNTARGTVVEAIDQGSTNNWIYLCIYFEVIVEKSGNCNEEN